MTGQEIGLEIWPVENTRTEADTPDFGVKRWPAGEYGSFYKGDSFSTYQQRVSLRCCRTYPVQRVKRSSWTEA